jgi:hypothetical protein
MHKQVRGESDWNPEVEDPNEQSGGVVFLDLEVWSPKNEERGYLIGFEFSYSCSFFLLQANLN